MRFGARRALAAGKSVAKANLAEIGNISRVMPTCPSCTGPTPSCDSEFTLHLSETWT